MIFTSFYVTRTLFGGETNARLTQWKDSSNNSNGKLLNDTAICNNITIHHPPCGTFISLAGQTHIDKFLACSEFPFAISNIKVTASFSDHSAITITLNTLSRSYLKVFTYELTDIADLNEFVEEKLRLISPSPEQQYESAALQNFHLQLNTISNSHLQRVLFKKSSKQHRGNYFV